MSEGAYFFATRSDLEPVFRGIEGCRAVKYVLMSLSEAADLTCVGSASSIPGFGTATAGAATREDRYLVIDRAATVAVRKVPQQPGGVRYAIDQVQNPGSVVLCAGGLFAASALINGEVSTASSSHMSHDLFRLILRHLKRSFERRKAFLIGPEALVLYQRGVRLTSDARAPVEYDLQL